MQMEFNWMPAAIETRTEPFTTCGGFGAAVELSGAGGQLKKMGTVAVQSGGGHPMDGE
jgi:hypothetical protein